MKKVTILIADDHTLVREAWSFIFNSHAHYCVVAECGSGEEAIERAKELRPQVVIMDINLPGVNGMEATQQIRKFSPGSRVLGVSLHTQPSYARKMVQNGAVGYLTKNSSREEMFKALTEILDGKKYICEEIKNILSEQMFSGGEAEPGIHALSTRELEIINYIRKGNSSRKIADSLNISVKTVEVHRYNILKKLNLKNAAALVNYINNSQLELIA